MKILPYGEDGVYIDLQVVDAPDRAQRTHALAARLRARFPEGDVVAGAGVVAVFGLSDDDLESAFALFSGENAAPPDVYTSDNDVYTAGRTRTHEIDVAYDGPDLDEVAERAGLSREELIDLHTGRAYSVELLGFLPGFAYLGPLDPRLVLPRRNAPRPRVDAQSVGIAATFSAIYPQASPGGWHLLGRSLGPKPFDPTRQEPFLFAPGDEVRFRRATGAAARASDETPAPAEGDAPNEVAHGLLVARAAGIATIQDQGRHGLLGKGMPPSGPLDPRLFHKANRAVGNRPGAAAIELWAGSLTFRARGAAAISIDGEPVKHLSDGEELRIGEGEGAVRYIAVSGGIDVPVVVRARATLLNAKLGGISGRALRTGDLLPMGTDRPAPGESPHAAASEPEGPTEEEALSKSSAPLSPAEARAMAARPARIRVEPGPHFDQFPEGAWERFLSSEWYISNVRDRTGVRLFGPPIPRSGPDLAAPVPMRRGAIQVTTSGIPIVLGPDHPTTGGYPVIAVVHPMDHGALAQKRTGRKIQFYL